jgi:hypothetical protein
LAKKVTHTQHYTGLKREREKAPGKCGCFSSDGGEKKDGAVNSFLGRHPKQKHGAIFKIESNVISQKKKKKSRHE